MVDTFSIFDNAFKQTFSDNVKEGYAARSILVPHFNVMPAEGEIYWARSITANDAITKGAKGTATQDSGTVVDARQLVTIAKTWSDLFSETDVVKMGNSPSSKLVSMGSQKLAVEFDKEILRSLGAAVNSKKDGNGFALPAAQIIDHSTSTFALDMLLEAHEKLDLGDVPQGPENRLFIYPAQIHRAALKINEVASSLYNEKQSLNDREVGTFTGAAWLNVNGLISPTAGVVRCYLVDKNAIEVGLWSDLKVRIAEVSEKNFDTRVYVEQYFGATRVFDKGVVAIDIKL